MSDDEIREIVRDLLEQTKLPRDALPYSPDFVVFKSEFELQTGHQITNAALWQLISSVSKRGGLRTPGKQKRAPKNRSVSLEEKLEILRLFPEGIGSRDNLPYTKKFDEAYRQFTKISTAKFTKHEFWRAVSGVAKYSRKPEPIFAQAPLGGLAQDAVQALERMNPWWRASPLPPLPSVRRDAFEAIWSQLHSRVTPVVAVRGPRQVGKTTIQHQIIEELLFINKVDPRRILRVQFDDTPALGTLQSPIEVIIRWFEENVLGKPLNTASREGKPAYLFFDEVQNLRQWSEQIKALVDTSSSLVLITGSSALRISEGRDSLAGRLSMRELTPLSLREIGRLRGCGQLPQFDPIQVDSLFSKPYWEDVLKTCESNRDAIEKAFSYFSDFGGYPICHKHAMTGNEQEVADLSRRVVTDIVERTITHDLVKGVPESIMREIFWLCCRYAGLRLSNPELTAQVATRLGGDQLRVSELEEALGYLENSLLIRRVRPVEIRNKKRSQPSTIALCDHFVRRSFIGDTVPLDPFVLQSLPETVSVQAGALMESTILYHAGALSNITINYVPHTPQENEIDLLLGYGSRRMPIEVKYKKRVVPSDCAAIGSFCEEDYNQAGFGLIVTQKRSGWITDRVLAVPAYAVLLVL